MDMREGSQIGRFELRQYLDRGGFGDVWIANDPARRELVALKLIRLVSLDPEMVEAEQKGGRLQQALACRIPAVAAIYDMGESSGFLYIAMEYVAGRDLSDVLKEGPLSVDRAVSIALQLCRILEISHELPTEDGRRGVVHSDIKPGNIRLQEGDRVRLLDWGVAKSLARSRKFTRHVFGSIPYLSPERLAQGVVDRHADLWAVGVVLYQMIAGSLPFSGETDEEMERKIRNRRQPERLPGYCPADLRRIIVRCLDFEVERRYPDAAALRADLEAFQQGRPLAPAALAGGDGMGATRRSAGVRQEPAKTSPPGRPAVRARKRRRGLRPVGLAAAALLALLLSQIPPVVVGREIRRDLTLAPHPDLLDLAARYQRVGWLDRLDLLNVRRNLKAGLVEAAEVVLGAYRADAAIAQEDWEEALQDLQSAAALDDEDDGVLARLRYIQGHLDRLAAEQAGPGSQRLLQQALDKFKEAARLAPELPDPYLGMLQIYADERYSPFDLEKLQGAYDRAVDLHHSPGDRERKALAAGYLRKGMTLYAQAEAMPGAPEKARLFDAARSQFNRSLTECRELTSRNVEVCEEAAARVRMTSALLRAAGYL